MMKFDRKKIIELVILGSAVIGIMFLLFVFGVFEFFTDRVRLFSFVEK